MAVYPAHRSVLVVEPIGLTNEDMEILGMENDPLEILKYFISSNESDPAYKSNIYEDFVENFEFDEEDRKQQDIMCRVCGDKFLFVNILKNTAWAAEQAECSIDSILNKIEKNKINAIRSKNNKYFLVVADDKFLNFKENRVVSIPSSDDKPKRSGASRKINDYILSGALGGKGARFTATYLCDEISKIHPEIDLGLVQSCCNTLVSHGDLKRVPVLDTSGRHKPQVDQNGNPTGKLSFARGKYEIGVETKNDRVTMVEEPDNDITKRVEVLETLVPAVVERNEELTSSSIPEKKEVVYRPSSGGPPKSLEKIAFDDFLDKNFHREFVFTIDDIMRDNPGLNRLRVQKRLIDAINKTNLRNHITRVKQGVYRFKPSVNSVEPKTVEPKTVEQISNNRSSNLNLDEIAAGLIKQGVPFTKVAEMIKNL